MRRCVYKYPLNITTQNDFQVPHGSRIVLAALDPLGHPCLWMDHDLARPLQTRSFVVHGTGHPIKPFSSHVGSFVSGDFIWHVYEVTK